MQTSGCTLDFTVLRQAIEGRDAETLVGFYAEDAEMLTVNRNSAPSSSRVLRGKAEISEYLRDVGSREMTHKVENEVVGVETLELRDGKIVQAVTRARIMAGAHETTTLLIKLGDPRPVSESLGTGA